MRASWPWPPWRSSCGRPAAIAAPSHAPTPGLSFAAITRRPHGYVVALVEGATPPTLNGQPIGTEAINLRHGDLLELAGTQMQFIQQ